MSLLLNSEAWTTTATTTIKITVRCTTTKRALFVDDRVDQKMRSSDKIVIYIKQQFFLKKLLKEIRDILIDFCIMPATKLNLS